MHKHCKGGKDKDRKTICKHCWYRIERKRYCKMCYVTINADKKTYDDDPDEDYKT